MEYVRSGVNALMRLFVGGELFLISFLLELSARRRPLMPVAWCCFYSSRQLHEILH